LKRYEELLKLYGAKVEPSEDSDDSNSETASPLDVEMNEDNESQTKARDGPFATLGETRPKLIAKEGMSRYFDRYFFKLLSVLDDGFLRLVVLFGQI
jgi:hypothetical protein